MKWVEAVGYLGSALVITSLAQTRVLWLRLFSLCGSVTFFVYAVLIGSVPIAITNTVLFVINAVHLWRLFSGREDFSLLEVAPDSPYLRRFLEFHADDIAASQPDFSGLREGDVVVMVLRDMVPTMVVVGRPRGKAFRVYLDYAIPSYRDFKGGRWLRGAGRFFHRLTSRDRRHWLTERQRRYLRRAGSASAKTASGSVPSESHVGGEKTYPSPRQLVLQGADLTAHQPILSVPDHHRPSACRRSQASPVERRDIAWVVSGVRFWRTTVSSAPSRSSRKRRFDSSGQRASTPGKASTAT